MNNSDLETTKEDDEISIPRAALNKYVKVLIPEARLTNETRELLLACCHQFIHSLATKSNDACSNANKKTINPEHVIQGLNMMGLDHYVEETRTANEEAKVELQGRRSLRASYKFKNKNSTELEELMRQQQELFDQAKANLVDETVVRNEFSAAQQSTHSFQSAFLGQEQSAGMSGSSQLLASGVQISGYDSQNSKPIDDDEDDYD
ncbi:Down-regulator of transcription 1 [Cichlidogyrus casuarinus]|uniref:Protein Dr1 n=1 Tax=Cichlidogyrus casuarinus TaxID=1844966 RepID=A0ABD2PR87_9PLAT